MTTAGTPEPWWREWPLGCVHLLMFAAYLMLIFDR